MQRYSMMKEIFVYVVGMKLKKHHKRRSAIVFTDNFRIGDIDNRWMTLALVSSSIFPLH
jgi:hypothetical protein